MYFCRVYVVYGIDIWQIEVAAMWLYVWNITAIDISVYHKAHWYTTDTADT